MKNVWAMVAAAVVIFVCSCSAVNRFEEKMRSEYEIRACPAAEVLFRVSPDGKVVTVYGVLAEHMHALDKRIVELEERLDAATRFRVTSNPGLIWISSCPLNGGAK